MSQATLTPDLLTALSNNETKSAFSFPNFFAVRSSLFTLIATGAMLVTGAIGVARLSDSIVESNDRASAMAVSSPPAVYYEFIAQYKNDTTSDGDSANAGVDAPSSPAASIAN